MEAVNLEALMKKERGFLNGVSKTTHILNLRQSRDSLALPDCETSLVVTSTLPILALKRMMQAYTGLNSLCRMPCPKPEGFVHNSHHDDLWAGIFLG